MSHQAGVCTGVPVMNQSPKPRTLERERRERNTHTCTHTHTHTDCFLEGAVLAVKMLNGQGDGNIPLVSFMPFTGTLRDETFPETIKR